MKHNTRLSWTVGLAIAAPVMALTGCPGLLGGTPTGTPTPAATTAATTAPTASPTTAATQAPLRTTLVVTKVTIGDTAQASRSVTLKNLGTAAVDLGTVAISYEYDSSTTTTADLKMQHLRVGTGSVAVGGEYTFTAAAGCTDGKCVSGGSTLGGTSATDMGLQASHGSLVLYKGISSSADFTQANTLDYVQYGADKPKTYTHAAQAVAAKVWDATGSYAVAPGAVGKYIQVKTAGATGSANWELK